MQFNQIEALTIQILQDADQKFLFPYQIYNRIKQRNPSIAAQIEAAYPAQSGNPIMGKDAGILYSPASFVAHALSYFKDAHGQIQKEWVDANDIEIKGVAPGNKETTSIWAWK